MLICIEGIDVAGKATMAERLRNYLNGRARASAVVSLPDYHSLSGHIIDGYLRRLWRAMPADGTADAEVLPALVDTAVLNEELFQEVQLVNKLEVAERIKQLQADRVDVILDRWWPSSWVYGCSLGLNGDRLLKLNAVLPQADLWLLLDIDVEDSFRRRPDRRDDYERREVLMEKALWLYRRLWQIERVAGCYGRWEVIDARGTQLETWEKIVSVLGIDCEWPHSYVQNL